MDQIVFRWDPVNDLGTTGFGPVAWSCGRERAEDIFRSVTPLLRARGATTAPALIRLEAPSGCLLIRRVPWRGPGGRTGTLCHALLGAPGVLDAETCLGLHAWDWRGGDPALGEVRGDIEAVRAAELLASVEDGRRGLVAELAGAGRTLTGLVAELLRHPTGHFTVLDRPGGPGPCPVLWGMFGIFGAARPTGWTFATHNTAESPMLRFLFVADWSAPAAPGAKRIRTDPGERVGDLAEELADGLVAHYLRGAALGGEGEYEVARALESALAGHRARGGSGSVLRPAAEDTLRILEDRDRRRSTAVRTAAVGQETLRGMEPDSYEAAAGRDVYEVPAGRGPYDERDAAIGHVRLDERPRHEPPPPHDVPAPAPAPSPAPAAAPAAAPHLRPVLPEWPSPRAHPRFIPRRRKASVPYPRLVAILASVDGQHPGRRREAQNAVRGAGDSDLIGALREDLHYDAVTLVIGEIARRWGWWRTPLRGDLCEAVLAMDLFLTHSCGPGTRGYPGDQLQASNAARLYRWAVRPLAKEPGPSASLAELLPRMAQGPQRVGRGAVRQILTGEGGPGIDDQVWLALLDAAQSPSPAPAPTPVPAGQEQRTPSPQAPPAAPPPRRSPEATHPRPDPASDSGLNDGRLIFLTLLGTLTAVIVILVMLIV